MQELHLEHTSNKEELETPNGVSSYLILERTTQEDRQDRAD
jgi:hypothetical protein